MTRGLTGRAVAAFAVAAVAVLAAGAVFAACMPRTDAPTRSRLYPGKPQLPAWADASVPGREALGQPSRQWIDGETALGPQRGAQLDDVRVSQPWQLGWRGRRGVARSYTPPRVVDMPPLTPAELAEALQAGPPYVELGGSNELIFEHGWIHHSVPAPELEKLPGIRPLTEFENGLVRLFAGEPVSVFCDERGPVAYWIPHRMGSQFGGHVVGRDGEVYWMLLPRPAYRVEPGSYLAFVPLPIPLDKLGRPARWGWRGARGVVLVAVHLGRIAMSAARRIVGRTHHLVRAMRVVQAAARAELERQMRVLAERAIRAAGRAARAVDGSLPFRGQARAAGGRAGRGGTSGAGGRGAFMLARPGRQRRAAQGRGRGSFQAAHERLLRGRERSAPGCRLEAARDRDPSPHPRGAARRTISMTEISRVYRFRYAEGYEWLLPINEEDIDRLLFDGRPWAQSWRPVRMRRLRISSAGRPLVLGDFQACSGGDMLMLGRRAKDMIGSYLERYGELLPLTCRDGEFWTLNITTVVDALDEDRSELLRASDDGTILWIDRHVFLPSALGSAEVFKLRQKVRSTIYVTEPFVRLVEETGLKGLEFTPVWEGY